MRSTDQISFEGRRPSKAVNAAKYEPAIEHGQQPYFRGCKGM